jgi:hypothetical protein
MASVGAIRSEGVELGLALVDDDAAAVGVARYHGRPCRRIEDDQVVSCHPA